APRQIVAIHADEVEDRVEHGDSSAAENTVAARTETGALLHEAERRAAFFVKCDDFSVEHSFLGFHQPGQSAQFGILRGQLILIAGNQAKVVVVDEGDGAVAIPFAFEEPLRMLNKVGTWRGKKWTD